MRLFAATLATETNTFSPLPTSLASYREGVFLRPGEHPDDAPRMCTAPLFVARRRAAKDGFNLMEGSCFAASPAGTTNREAYEAMRDEILDQLRRALPLDGVLLGLHGAMVAYGYDDVEGDLLERVRAIVPPRCVIGVELDPHCHLTLKRVELADIIVLYKEFPHTDVVERAEDVLDLLLAANIAVAVIVLLTTIYVRTPLEFSIFPSLLLATTLARLVLNVATTRLILTRGGSDGLLAAGEVVRNFGEFVAGDKLVAGLVIFAIIVVIQFVVITKGATRISEVAAQLQRHTHDREEIRSD